MIINGSSSNRSEKKIIGQLLLNHYQENKKKINIKSHCARQLHTTSKLSLFDHSVTANRFLHTLTFQRRKRGRSYKDCKLN